MKELTLIEQMLRLQQRLNDDTNGAGWEAGVTKEGKLISWKRCIYMECAELIDSFPWKHWKNISAPVDKENVAVEIVDIWHFVMSLGLEIASTERKSLATLASDITAVSGFSEFSKEPFNIDNYNAYEIINDVEIIINRCSGFNLDFGDLLRDYFRLSLKCGVNLRRLFEVYMGKNVLNKFRQDHGYKEGTYLKVWDGKEDNVVMSEILRNGASEWDEIYAALAKAYYKAGGAKPSSNLKGDAKVSNLGAASVNNSNLKTK